MNLLELARIPAVEWRLGEMPLPATDLGAVCGIQFLSASVKALGNRSASLSVILIA